MFPLLVLCSFFEIDLCLTSGAVITGLAEGRETTYYHSYCHNHHYIIFNNTIIIIIIYIAIINIFSTFLL